MKYTPLFLSPLGLIPAGHPSLAGDTAALPPNAQPVKFEKFGPAWSGFYVGISGGAQSARSSVGTFTGSGANTNACLNNDCAYTLSQSPTGFIGGVQIGYNFQTGNIVYGAEADFSLTTAKSSTSIAAQNGAPGLESDTGIKQFGTARLRLGYAFDNLLVYGTGGVAYAKLRDGVQATSNIATNNYSWTNGSWRTGYTLGGGLEYMLTRNWSVKGEALYYDLGTKRSQTEGGPVGVTYAYGVTEKTTGIVARIGLNYQFH